MSNSTPSIGAESRSRRSSRSHCPQSGHNLDPGGSPTDRGPNADTAGQPGQRGRLRRNRQTSDPPREPARARRRPRYRAASFTRETAMARNVTPAKQRNQMEPLSLTTKKQQTEWNNLQDIAVQVPTEEVGGARSVRLTPVAVVEGSLSCPRVAAIMGRVRSSPASWDEAGGSRNSVSVVCAGDTPVDHNLTSPGRPVAGQPVMHREPGPTRVKRPVSACW